MKLSCLDNFIPPLPDIHGSPSRLSESARTLQRSILSVPGTSIFLKRSGRHHSGPYAHTYSINRLEQLDDRCRVTTLGDMRAVTGGGFSLYRRSSTGKEPSYCLPDASNCGSAMDALVRLFELVAPDGNDAGERSALTNTARTLRQEFDCYKRVFEDGAFTPLDGNEVIQILASTDGAEGLVIGQIVHSRHIERFEDGRVPSHLCLLRRIDFEDCRYAGAGRPLIIETDKGWSCGPERRLNHNGGRARHTAIKTTWHSDFGAALRKAITYIRSPRRGHTGHTSMAEMEFLSNIERRCKGAARPQDVFPLAGDGARPFEAALETARMAYSSKEPEAIAC